MQLPDSTDTHAMCDHYGHEWRKNDLLTARAKHYIRVETCARKGCDAGRRIYTGR